MTEGHNTFSTRLRVLSRGLPLSRRQTAHTEHTRKHNSIPSQKTKELSRTHKVIMPSKHCQNTFFSQTVTENCLQRTVEKFHTDPSKQKERKKTKHRWCSGDLSFCWSLYRTPTKRNRAVCQGALLEQQCYFIAKIVVFS